MKTMTCKQLGGPCDLGLQGETADEVIKAQDRHLKDEVAGGDESHEPALERHEEQVAATDLGYGLVQADEAGLRRPAPGLTIERTRSATVSPEVRRARGSGCAWRPECR